MYQSTLTRMVLASVLTASCSWMGGAAMAGPALDAIKARGELRVGTTGDYKPFTYKGDDGKLWGADVAMAEDLAQKLGVKLVIVPTIWGKLMDDFSSDKFDVAMGGVTITPQRAEKAYFSVPTFIDGKRPITRCADKDKFKALDDVNKPEVRVIVNPGGQNEKFAREKLTGAKVNVHTDNKTVFDEIAAGRADVMVTDGIEVDLTSKLNPALCPASVAAPFTRLEKAYMMPRDDELKAFIDGWVQETKTTGRWDKALADAMAHR